VKLVVKSGGVPIGAHIAKFIGVEPTTTTYGDGLKWLFEVSAGPNAGARVSRITGNDPTPRNKCGEMLAGLSGKKLTDGETIDPDAFKGKTYLIVVAATDSGASRVESVSAPPPT